MNNRARTPIAGRVWVRVSKLMNIAVINEKVLDSDLFARKRCILIDSDQIESVKLISGLSYPYCLSTFETRLREVKFGSHSLYASNLQKARGFSG